MRVKDWNRFQHYKTEGRNPDWIKLYRGIVDDIEWHALDDAAARLLLMIWLIASEKNGEVPPARVLAFRCRKTEAQVNAALSKLGHFLEQDASDALAPRYQTACIEEKRREEEIEGEENKKGIRARKTLTTTTMGEFELWWDEYPHKVGKRDAMTAFSNALLRGATLDALLSGVRAYRSAKPPDRQWCNPATWLNQDRYLDAPARVAPPVSKTRQQLNSVMEDIYARSRMPVPSERGVRGEDRGPVGAVLALPANRPTGLHATSDPAHGGEAPRAVKANGQFD